MTYTFAVRLYSSKSGVKHYKLESFLGNKRVQTTVADVNDDFMWNLNLVG